MTARIIIFSLIVIVALHSLKLFETINNWIYDNYIILNKQESYNKEIVIVGIDSKTIKEVGNWPLKRSLYAEAIKRIISSEPAVIGLCLSFTQTIGSVSEDQKMYKMLKSFPDILIATRFQYKQIGKKLRILVPEKSLFPDIKQGHILFSEKDIIRSFPAFKIVPAFALQTVKLYFKNNNIDRSEPDKELLSLLNKTEDVNYSTSDNLLIDYQRGPENFREISFGDVLSNKFQAEELKDKIVLIGITDKYYSSIFATPYSRLKDSFTSTFVELQAQIIDSLLQFRNLKTMSAFMVYLISILLSISFLLIINSRSIIIQGIILVCSFIFTIIFSYILFKYMAIWFPPALLLVSILTISGFSGYFTINQVDSQLVTAINKLHEDQNIPLSSTPQDISHKMDVLKEFMNIIVTDRQTIKAIINGVDNGIIVFDEEGKILWSSGSFINLFKDNLVLESSIQNLIPDLDIANVVRDIRERSTFKSEMCINGKEMACVINPIHSIEIKYVAIFNDITELKEIGRLKSDMVRMVSHELKSPLMNILLACENISDFEERDITLQSSAKIANSSTYMLNTINNFLNLNKLEENLFNPEITSIDLMEEIDRIIEINSQVAENNKITINKEINHRSKALADRNLLEIVLNNIISNAIKYSMPETGILIKTEESDQNINVCVIDSGIGISQDELNKVFEKFYRATNLKETQIKGTGLGLSIVKKILELHNSDIEISSELNKGTTVKFSLIKEA